MRTRPEQLPDQALADVRETHALLRQILTAVQGDQRRGRLELALAIILSLATLGSTWCAYQVGLWGDAEDTAQAAADTAEREAAEETIAGLQIRTFDGIAMLNYWNALREHDTQTCQAILARLRPQLRKAIEAAIAAGVLTNPEVAGPLQRPEYVLPEDQRAKEHRAEATRLKGEVQTAGRACSDYVLMTLMFASVLFFGGIAGTFSSRRVRNCLGGVALLLFVITIGFLARLPIFTVEVPIG